MATFVRSFDPIWFNVDLQAKAFDDTFYLWTLQNTIPYLPATVWHDPQGQVPWTDPIQFLANGTLPVDIYWDPSAVYRLEFRQNVNGLPPSQNDVLIYEVNNYTPGEGGNVPPVNGASSITDNQITNPQFALFNLANPTVLTAAVMTPSSPLHIGPGWDLLLNGTGNATITQVPLNSALSSPTNAPYALRLQLADWTDPPILRQRFVQNGQNWTGLNVSTSITAQAGTPGVQLTARLVDSMGTVLTNVLTPAQATLSTSFNEFKGFGLVPTPSTDTDIPPAAYIDYQIILPQSDIYLTSIQVIASGTNVAVPFTYEEDTVNRQIDHSYNTAYPIVPVGTVIDFGGFGTPDHYLPCDGTTRLRRDFNLLFQAMTNLETVTLTSGSPTITVANGALYRISAPIEGTGIPATTIISNIVGNVITMSLNATSNGPSSLRFFASGNGDGSTTFNVYDLRGDVIAGAGTSVNNLFAGTNALGQFGGTATHAISIAEMPTHNHNPLGVTSSVALGISAVATAGVAGVGVNTGPTLLNITPEGGGQAMSLVQPTILLNKCIRYE